MLLFLVEKRILHIITEYIYHLKWYLKEFAVNADIVVYQELPVDIPDTCTDIIFVQKINPHIMNDLNGIPNRTIEKVTLRRNTVAFKANRTTTNPLDYKRGTSVALVLPQKTTRPSQKICTPQKINPYRQTITPRVTNPLSEHSDISLRNPAPARHIPPLPADYTRPPVITEIHQERDHIIRATPMMRSSVPQKRPSAPQKRPEEVIRATPKQTSLPEIRERRIFLLNTEQMTVPMFLHNTKMDIHKYNPCIIDYSQENIAILRKHFPASKFIYFPYPFKVQSPVAKQHPLVSLLSSQYRRTICKNLGTPILNFAGHWGDVRDEMLKKSKILVNIHYQSDTYRIFESIRCYNALEQRTLIISEPSYDKNLLLLKDYIIFAPKEQMRDKVQEVLENYQLYYEQVFSEPRIKEMEKRLKDVYRTNIEKMAVTPSKR